jgi:hypothetical protein
MRGFVIRIVLKTFHLRGFNAEQNDIFRLLGKRLRFMKPNNYTTGNSLRFCAIDENGSLVRKVQAYKGVCESNTQK